MRVVFRETNAVIGFFFSTDNKVRRNVLYQRKIVDGRLFGLHLEQYYK